jgi:hypothetical protein
MLASHRLAANDSPQDDDAPDRSRHRGYPKMVVRSAQELAHGLNDRLKLGLTPRPWNIYAPADTFWWLVPSTDWPAYRYGKLAFSHAADAPRKDLLGTNDESLDVDQIFAGFNVEKGFGKVAAVVNPALNRKPEQIIDPQWLWFELTSTLGAERFSHTLATAAAHAEIFAYVVAGHVQDRDASGSGQHDAVVFKCSVTGLAMVSRNAFPINSLRGTETATTFAELADHLRTIDDFHWVDLYIGTHVPKGDVDLAELHSRVMSCFDAWLR